MWGLAAHGDHLGPAPAAEWVEPHAVALLVQVSRQLGAQLQDLASIQPAFEQRELVARAFAGDNVVQDFAELKRREMKEDAPKEVDTTLPGWVC